MACCDHKLEQVALAAAAAAATSLAAVADTNSDGSIAANHAVERTVQEEVPAILAAAAPMASEMATTLLKEAEANEARVPPHLWKKSVWAAC